MAEKAFRLPTILATEGVAASRGGPYIPLSAGDSSAITEEI